MSPRAACGATPPVREIAVDGVRIAYDDVGSGPPLVCLHAVAHGARDFAALGRALAGRHRVLALDWPGHGRSDDDRVPPSATRYASLLAGFLDALGLARPVLLGNSIGGAVALRLAATAPDRVAGIVLENPGGLDRSDAVARAAIAAMVRFFAAGARGARWFPAAYALYYRLVLTRRAAADARRRVVAAGPAMAPLLRDAWESFGRPEEDLRPLVARIRCPVLFAWATRDRFIQLRRCLPGIRLVPGARVERFPAGHAPHLETPDAFLAVLEPFLASVTAGARGTHALRSLRESSGSPG
jgi:4,5:9,10-diseco-3-hydroxy-5,9,17-trioxoandrosta-1(10),2-diene-4-oate hydrolase